MASKPSQKQCFKIGAAKFPALANLTVPEVKSNFASPTTPKKKNIFQEPTSDLLNNLNRLQQQLTKISKNLEGQLDVMNERIEFFESNLLTNKEEIENIKQKISKLTCNSLNDSKFKDKDKIEFEAKSLSKNTVVDFLQNHPIVLSIFLNQSEHFQGENSNLFNEFTQFLQKDTKNIFIQYSLQQLNRFSQCFSIFNELITKSKNLSFFDSLSESIKQIFKTNSCYFFIKNPKRGNFSCYFESKEMQIIISDSRTIISDVIESGKAKTYTDVLSSPFYSPSFDPLFNPNNKSLLLIPILNKAVIYILHTDPLSFCFTNEDCVVGSLLSILIEPMLLDHLNHQTIANEVRKRNELCQFENEVLKISHFCDLLPFLQNALANQISTKKVELFLIDDQGIFSYIIMQSDGQVRRKNYDRCGTILYISEKKRYITVNKLNKVTVSSYDDRIDSWSKYQPYSAYPIFGANNKVISVLCVSGKRGVNKFNEWDNEFIQSITPVLGIIIQRCIESEIKVEEDQIKEDLTNFPVSFASLKPPLFIKSDFLRLIAMEIEEVIHSEWLSIFVNTKLEISLHNHQVYDKPIISVSYSSKFFGKSDENAGENSFISNDVSRVPDFEVGDSDDIENPSSFVLATHNDITICAINAKTQLGHFTDINIEILKAFASVIMIAKNINELNLSSLNSKLAIQSLYSVIEYCQKSIKDEFPLKFLMDSLLELTKIDGYCFLKRIKLNRYFKPIYSSFEIQETEILESDPLIKSSLEKNTNFEVGPNEFDTKMNELNNNGLKVRMVSTIEKNDVYLFYFGKEKINEEFFILLSKLAALIKAYLNLYVLSSRPDIISISNMNKLDVYNSSIKNDYLLSSFFVSTSLSETQQIESLLLMIKELNISDILHIDLYKFALIIYDIKKKYNNVPYHNFFHAIDVSQFVFMTLKKGNLTKIFEPLEIVSLFLGALCHDISHNGIDSTTLDRCGSGLSFSFGNLSPLERNHAFIASELLKKSELAKSIDNPQFWHFFVDVIVATDITRASEFSDKFKNQISEKGKFDKTIFEHRLLLAQLILICGNVANCFRPFEFARSMAELLDEERNTQCEYEKAHYIIRDNENNIKLDVREVDFIEKIVSPLFNALYLVVPNLDNIPKLLNENVEKWKKYSPSEKSI